MKLWWKSRSLWLHGAAVVAPWIPYLHAWIAEHPIQVMQYHALVAFVLRFDTSKPLCRHEPKEES